MREALADRFGVAQSERAGDVGHVVERVGVAADVARVVRPTISAGIEAGELLIHHQTGAAVFRRDAGERLRVGSTDAVDGSAAERAVEALRRRRRHDSREADRSDESESEFLHRCIPLTKGGPLWPPEHIEPGAQKKRLRREGANITQS